MGKVGTNFSVPESNVFFFLREIIPFENLMSFEIWLSECPWELPPDCHVEGGKYSPMVTFVPLSGNGNVCGLHIRNRKEIILWVLETHSRWKHNKNHYFLGIEDQIFMQTLWVGTAQRGLQERCGKG